MDSEQTKYPVWSISGELTPDELEFYIPVEPIAEFPKLGGGMKDLMHFLDNCLDACEVEDENWAGVKLTIGLKFCTKDELSELWDYE